MPSSAPAVPAGQSAAETRAKVLQLPLERAELSRIRTERTPLPRWLLCFGIAAALHVAVLVGFGKPAPAQPRLLESAPVLSLQFATASEPETPVAAPAPKPVPPTEQRPTPQPRAVPPRAPDSPAPTATTPLAEAPSPQDVEPAPTPQPEPAAAASAEPTTDVVPDSTPVVSRFSGAPAKTSRGYFSQITAWIDANKTYPVAAKQAKQQGIVVVRFSIDRQGRLLSSSIKQSSGHAALDEEALATLARAAPFPAIPEFIDKDTLTLSVPIDFSLITD